MFNFFFLFYLDEPPARYCSRRKSVFAETYNPEEDEEEEGPNVFILTQIAYFYFCETYVSIFFRLYFLNLTINVKHLQPALKIYLYSGPWIL